MAAGNEKGNLAGSPAESQQQPLTELSSEELAVRSQAGCRESFSVLVDRYGQRLLSFLYRRTANLHDAEDLVQDTFIRAYTNIGRYDNSWRFSTWLYTIAARLASSRYRKLRPMQRLEDRQGDIYESRDQEQKEAHQGLWKLAESLSVNQYQALFLKYSEDMSVKEISKVMKKSKTLVKVLLYRARNNLAKKIESSQLEWEQEKQTLGERKSSVSVL
jgi:RNA polymerase sigma-70 factor (ECF subfamily)